MKNQLLKYSLILLLFSILISCEKDPDMPLEDEECTEETWFQDVDGDGFGNPDITELACDQPLEYVSDNSDFNDNDATSYPGAEEICDDNVDNNGNGETDECGLIYSITGDWTDNFGSQYSITSSSLTINTNGNVYHILTSGIDYVICLNDSNNPFFADLYSKFVFTNVSTDEFHYCQSYYDSTSLMEIEDSSEPSDSNDLLGGCGGFAWGVMTRD